MSARDVARSINAGRVALGLSLVLAPRYQRAVALCDAVDLAATLAARRALPKTGVALIVVLAGTAIAGQLWAARELAAAALANASPPAE